jgi:HEAT repeat protein
MSQSNPPGESSKKLLENPIIGSLVVPIAIVLVGALIVFGVTKMLSTERSYKDLVREMHSKTFGNRWIAAYELSKVISSSQIPEKDLPWLIQNLVEIYDEAVDPRTRDFIVVALGALRSELAVPLFERALKDVDKNVRFHALVALGNMSKEFSFNWDLALPFLSSEDRAMQQVAILALATHRVQNAKAPLEGLLSNPHLGIRYATATGLIAYESQRAIPVLKEILLLDSLPVTPNPFNSDQVMNLKLNILNALQKYNWTVLNSTLEEMAQRDKNSKVMVKGREVLNKLKN